jgi:hypothetical protein
MKRASQEKRAAPITCRIKVRALKKASAQWAQVLTDRLLD